MLFFCYFVFGSAGSSLLRGLFSSWGEQGPPSICDVGFSMWWLLLLWNMGGL